MQLWKQIFFLCLNSPQSTLQGFRVLVVRLSFKRPQQHHSPKISRSIIARSLKVKICKT